MIVLPRTLDPFLGNDEAHEPGTRNRGKSNKGMGDAVVLFVCRPELYWRWRCCFSIDLALLMLARLIAHAASGLAYQQVLFLSARGA